MPLSFLFVFICSLLFMICTMYFVLLKNLQHLHGYTNYWICLTINGILSQLWHDHFAERFISKVWLVLDHISVMENLCPQTPPLNFYNSPPPPPPPPLLLSSPTSPTSRIDHGKFYPGLLKIWFGLLIFEARSLKGSLAISSGNSLAVCSYQASLRKNIVTKIC